MTDRIRLGDFNGPPRRSADFRVGANHDAEVELVAYSARALMALPDPPASGELLGQLVYQGSRTILVGATGHGKTTLALQMVRAIVAGEEWLGLAGAGRGPALILDLEQGLKSIKRGLRDAGLAERDDVLCVSVPDGLAIDRDVLHLAALDGLLQTYRPAVVLLDPYYKAHRAEDPNAERPIIDLMRQLDHLRASYGFALILPAHPRKADPKLVGMRKLSIDDVAGSGAVTRGAEVVLGIERLHQGAARLRYLKDRDGESPIGEHLLLTFTRGEGFRINEETPDTPEVLKAKILDGPADTWLTTREWASEVKVDHNRVKAMLAAMAEAPEEPIYFSCPAPGRHPTARCYARCIEPPIHLNTPSQLGLEQAGVLGVSPLRGDEGDTPTPGPAQGVNTPPLSGDGPNPLLEPEEEA
jgi:hypothetical protein